MKVFRYRGKIPASKSLMNRALIVQSYEPRLKLVGDSSCDDVTHLRECLSDLHQKSLDCGEGGTTLRFLAFRISREEGEFFLKGTARLLNRPQKEIAEILKHFGVRVEFEKKGLRISSEGWQKPRGVLKVSAQASSQFLSALFLNAWNLDFDLKIQIEGKITSESYFTMTLKMLKDLGLQFTRRGSHFTIPKKQKVSVKTYEVESDLSSLFSVAAFAAISGEASFLDFPRHSLQPDLAFTEIFENMGVKIQKTAKKLTVKSPRVLKPVHANLQNSPDLFPVLAVACSFAEGRSVLYGAPQLALKESDRIGKTAELLEKAGVSCRPREDGMEIFGNPGRRPAKNFSFNPDKDHRLAMAAAVLKFFGQGIKIQDPDVVRKSFPEFWKDVGVQP